MPLVCIVRGYVTPKSDNATVNKLGGTVWLSVEEGYEQWTDNFDWAEPYPSKQEAQEAVKSCPGPWYNIPDPDSITYLEAAYTPPKKAQLALTGKVWI
jgi:hypothetical protein